jgi:hypothetical protein
MVCPVCRNGLYSWVRANYSAFWGLTLEEGIKKRLGAFRPDFPVAAGQQVSLIWYVLDAGTVCTAGLEPTTPPTGDGPWRRESRSAWVLSDPAFPKLARLV